MFNFFDISYPWGERIDSFADTIEQGKIEKRNRKLIIQHDAFLMVWTSFSKVSISGTPIMIYSKESRVRSKIGFKSVNGKLAQIRWSRKHQKWFVHLYPN
jgi:hypothetical protein